MANLKKALNYPKLVKKGMKIISYTSGKRVFAILLISPDESLWKYLSKIL